MGPHQPVRGTPVTSTYASPCLPAGAAEAFMLYYDI